jgi:hypothetical protein
MTEKRESLLQRVEGSAARRHGFAMATDESIADLPTLPARIEPFAQRTERARAEAGRLNAEAKAVEDAARQQDWLRKINPPDTSFLEAVRRRRVVTIMSMASTAIPSAPTICNLPFDGSRCDSTVVSVGR